MVTAEPATMETRPPATTPAPASAAKAITRLPTAAVPSAAAPGAAATERKNIIVDINDVDFFYGSTQALHDITLGLEAKKV